jgi:prevent-host-death family protein
MTVYSRDIIPLSAARARLSELADEARSGEDKIITRNGEAFVALIDVKKLERYQQLERLDQERELARDVLRGLEDAVEGRTLTEREFKGSLKGRLARLRKPR